MCVCECVNVRVLNWMYKTCCSGRVCTVYTVYTANWFFCLSTTWPTESVYKIKKTTKTDSGNNTIALGKAGSFYVTLHLVKRFEWDGAFSFLWVLDKETTQRLFTPDNLVEFFFQCVWIFAKLLSQKRFK